MQYVAWGAGKQWGAASRLWKALQVKKVEEIGFGATGKRNPGRILSRELI